MDISRQNAMQIVVEISSIIQQHVNMMDEHGIIIASTNPERLDTYHEGAARVIQQKLNELIISADGELEGARKGINLPIVLDDAIVGVVGITGEYDEVVKYGQIIKKMTEILLRENLLNQQRKIDDRIRSRFLDEWILDGATITSEFAERGARLGIDVKQPYRVVVATIADLRRYADDPEGQILIDRINRRVRRAMENAGGLFAKTATRMICLFPSLSTEQYRLVQFAHNLQNKINEEFSIQLLLGIDSPCLSVHGGYLQAVKALGACSPVLGRTVCGYEDVNLEIFMDEVSPYSKREFVRRIFRGFSDEEIAVWVRILQVYFAAEGSISKAAEQLFLHKNTLQYKLKKLCDQTGYNPKTPAGGALYYLAIQFYLAGEN